MVTPSSWMYLVLICILLVVYILTLSTKQTSVFFPMVLMLVFFSLFVISQFPALSDKDYLLHGKETNLIIAEGKIEITHHTSYLQWPGKFIIEACVRRVTGLEQVDLMRILTFAFQLLIIIPYYLISKKFLGRFLGGLVPTLFILSNLSYTRDTFDHFCPQLLSIFLYITTMYLYFKIDDLKRHYVLVIVLLGIGMTVSHPITTPFFVSSLFGVAMAKKYLARRTRIRFPAIPGLNLFILMLVIWLAWTTYAAAPYISTSVKTLFYSRTEQTIKELAPIGYSAIEDANIRLLLSSLSGYWKAIDLFIVVGAFALILFKRDNRKDTIIFSGIMLGNILYGLTAPLFWTSRIIMFTLLPACYLATRFFTQLIRKKIFAVILVCLVVPSFLRVYSFTSEYRVQVHPWENYLCVFLQRHNSGQKVVSSDYETMCIYTYYDSGSWPDGIVGDEEIRNYSIPVSEHPLYKGDFFIRSVRQDIAYKNLFNESSHAESFAYWNHLDAFLKNSPDKGRIFDNGYAQIYARS